MAFGGGARLVGRSKGHVSDMKLVYGLTRQRIKDEGAGQVWLDNGIRMSAGGLPIQIHTHLLEAPDLEQRSVAFCRSHFEKLN